MRRKKRGNLRGTNSRKHKVTEELQVTYLPSLIYFSLYSFNHGLHELCLIRKREHKAFPKFNKLFLIKKHKHLLLGIFSVVNENNSTHIKKV